MLIKPMRAPLQPIAGVLQEAVRKATCEKKSGDRG